MRKFIAIPEEFHDKIRGEAHQKRMSIYTLTKQILMRYYDPDNEVPTIQVGEATPKPAVRVKRDRADDDEFIRYFVEQYAKRIDPKPVYVDKAIVYKNITKPLEFYKLEGLKDMLDAYFQSDDQYFKSMKWSILVFLSMKTLNKLQ